MPVLLPTPVIGVQIDGFVIRRELARGGMGAVYLAEHHRLNGLHKVIKVILPEFAACTDVRARFEREAAAAARLRHKRILGIDGFGELPDGQLWLMTPFLQGISLREHLQQKGALSRQEALRVMVQLCAALDHAHRALVIHRDVKPSNIFLCPEEDDPWAIQLLDFGIAKILLQRDAADTRTGHIVGTPHYMPVEAYEGSNVTRRSDIFSAGIVAHEVITRKRPWNVPDETAPGILYYLQKTQPPDLRVLEWNEVLAQALAVDHTQRHGDARAFGLALAMQTTGGMEVLRQVAPELLRDPSAPHRAVRVRASDVTLRSSHSDITLDTPRDGTIVSGEITVVSQRSISWKLLAFALFVCVLAGTTTFTVVRHAIGPTVHKLLPPSP